MMTLLQKPQETGTSEITHQINPQGNVNSQTLHGSVNLKNRLDYYSLGRICSTYSVIAKTDYFIEGTVTGNFYSTTNSPVQTKNTGVFSIYYFSNQFILLHSDWPPPKY